MPKKTKKQKIEARRHRLKKKDVVTPIYTEKAHATTPSFVVPDTHEVAPKKTIFQDQAENTTYFRHDLLKSLMITMIILCVQMGIYVAQLSGIVDITNLISF